MRYSLLLPMLATSVCLAQSPICGTLTEKRARCRFDDSALAGRSQLTLPFSMKADKLGAYRQGANDVWVGRLAGQPGSEVALVAYEGQLIGNIRTEAGEFYTIRPAANGDVEWREVSQLTAAADSLGVIPSAATLRALEMPRLAVPSTIDVLVVYTPAARTAAGGTGAIQARIALAVAEANLALSTSLVDASFHLVGTIETAPASGFPEAPTPAYLFDVAADPAIAAARNTTGADLVSVWINGAGAVTGASGAGYIMTSPGPGFAPNAYSLVELNFALGPHYIFSRGLGQNMGATVDRANAPSPGAFSYSYGYQSQAGKFLDIMAGTQGCKLCVRKNYFANPAVLFSGFPGGVADPSPTSADLALTFNNTRAIVEAFRAPGVPNVPAPPPISGPFIKGITANPLRITAGEQTAIYWETLNATALTLAPAPGIVTGLTSVLVSPAMTTRYTLTATDGVTNVSAFVDVVVDPVADPLATSPPLLTFPNDGAYTFPTGVGVNVVPTNTGGPVTSCNSLQPLPAGLTLASDCTLGGTPTVAQAEATYRLIYLNAYGGRVKNIKITITGDPAPPPPVPLPVITSFTATPSNINPGESSTLNWVLSNATTLSISGIGNVTGSGRVVTPGLTTTYVLTATNSVGAFVTAQATVTVNTPGGGGPSPVISFLAPLANQTISGIFYFTVGVPNTIQAVSGNLKIDANLAYPLFQSQSGFTTGVNLARFAAGTHTALATVTDKNNIDYPATVNFVIGAAPTAPLPVISSFIATPASIAAGQSSTLTWAVANAATLSIGGIGTVTGTSTNVIPAGTTTYVLTATNIDGISVTASTTVTVSGGPPPPVGNGINIVTPTAGQNVNGVLFITSEVVGFTPAAGFLDLMVGNFRSGKAFPGGGGTYTGGLNLNGLALGATQLTVSATGTNGVLYTKTIPLMITAP